MKKRASFRSSTAHKRTQHVYVVHNNCHANYGTTNAAEITEMLIEADEERRRRVARLR